MSILSNFIIVFVFAHLLGDFVLQTNRIAKIKSESVKGIIYHVLIVTVSQVLVLSIFGLKGIFAGIVTGVIHFFIDWMKLKTNKYFINVQSIYFIFDQGLHLCAIFFISMIIRPKLHISFNYFEYILYLCIAIVLTYVITIFVKILLRDIKCVDNCNSLFNKNERIIDSIFSLIIFIALSNLNIWAAFGFTIIFYLLYFIVERKMYKYFFKVSFAKYFIFFIVSYLSSLIIK